MEKPSKYTRPDFNKAIHAWTELLKERRLPNEVIWIFDENLCFERDNSSPGGYRLGFQLAFTPPPLNAERIAFDHFSESGSRLVFYRIGSCGGKSICLMLCDAWFEGKSSNEGFSRRDEWLISFRPGGPEEIAEIQDEEQWKKRILRDRPLHDLDFCMSLRAVHETLAHGRVLSTYERYALRFLHSWRRLLGHPD